MVFGALRAYTSDGHARHQLLGFLRNEDIEPTPLAPSLLCLAVLTSVFFTVYLAVIGVRLCRMAQLARKQLLAVEMALFEATGSLASVPMLCILMVSARLRAMQLGLGDPQSWAMWSMYAATLAFLARFAGDLVSGPIAEPGEGEARPAVATVLLVWRIICSALLYGACIAIFASVAMMRPADAGATVPPHPPMTQCTLLLTAFYFVLLLGLEIAGGGRCPNAEQAQSALKPLTLQFTPMYCVLLVGITLRALQIHGFEPELWVCVAMYWATLAIVVQAALALLPVMVAGIKVTPGLSSMEWAVIFCLYLGVIATLASVLSMEAVAGGEGGGAEAPTISAAMHCVMLLTLLYFGVSLLSLVEAAKRFLEGTQWLAFMPTLCVVLIAVRLRAMQLGVRDPQPWAQAAMYASTCAVAVQLAASVLLACFPGMGDNDNMEDANEEEKQVHTKIAIIALLAVRYIAVFVLYVAMGVLITALFVMEAEQ